MLFRSQWTLSFAIIICRWQENVSLRNVKCLSGTCPEVIMGSRTPFTVGSLEVAVLEGMGCDVLVSHVPPVLLLAMGVTP